MEVRNSNFAAFIDIFTANTYVMVIMSDQTIRKSITYEISNILESAATQINIALARSHFEKFIQSDGKTNFAASLY